METRKKLDKEHPYFNEIHKKNSEAIMKSLAERDPKSIDWKAELRRHNEMHAALLK